jgi:predicted RNase H-like HicB family nuclease
MKIENYTARYIKISRGYMGQLLEWPEVVTEGRDLDDCRQSLKDALNEMILAYKQAGKEIPRGSELFEPISAPV